MCAVVGTFISASLTELWAIPPVRSASHSAASLATGMKVGLGRSGSCSVCSRTSPERFSFGRRAIALSSVCMTRTMIVRRDQPRGHITFANLPGWRRICASSFSGRVILVPSPTSSV